MATTMRAASLKKPSTHSIVADLNIERIVNAIRPIKERVAQGHEPEEVLLSAPDPTSGARKSTRRRYVNCERN